MKGVLLFGIGFGVLGYWPGTVAGANGQGQLDAFIGGAGGILIGSGLFAWFTLRSIRNFSPYGGFLLRRFQKFLDFPGGW